jgi:hypothetical protein
VRTGQPLAVGFAQVLTGQVGAVRDQPLKLQLNVVPVKEDDRVDKEIRVPPVLDDVIGENPPGAAVAFGICVFSCAPNPGVRLPIVLRLRRTGRGCRFSEKSGTKPS